MKGLPRLAHFLPKVVLALLVSVSAEGYKKLAIWLNDMGTLCRGGGPYGFGQPNQPSSWPSSAPRELPAGECL